MTLLKRDLKIWTGKIFSLDTTKKCVLLKCDLFLRSMNTLGRSSLSHLTACGLWGKRQQLQIYFKDKNTNPERSRKAAGAVLRPADEWLGELEARCVVCVSPRLSRSAVCHNPADHTLARRRAKFKWLGFTVCQ